MKTKKRYISTLLPLRDRGADDKTPWVLFDLHDDTTGIFDAIRMYALEWGAVQDADYANVFHKGGVGYVGYWTTDEDLESKIALLNRTGCPEDADTLACNYDALLRGVPTWR